MEDIKFNERKRIISEVIESLPEGVREKVIPLLDDDIQINSILAVMLMSAALAHEDRKDAENLTVAVERLRMTLQNVPETVTGVTESLEAAINSTTQAFGKGMMKSLPNALSATLAPSMAQAVENATSKLTITLTKELMITYGSGMIFVFLCGALLGALIAR